MVPEEILMVVKAGIEVGPLYPVDSGRPGVCSCFRGEACGPNTAKHPIPRHGKDDFTTDLKVIERWAKSYPGCNWGGRPPEGTFVLDVDPRNGGHDSLAKLEGEGRFLPPTLTAKTGGGGLHLWFTGKSRRGKLGDDYPGLDIKTHSGMLVLPPSVHRSGNAYEWLNLRPAEYSPNWLHDLLNPPVTHIKVSRHVRPAQLVKYVAESTTDRNNRLFWAACRIAEQGGDPFILREAAEACGLDAAEYEKTLRSAAKTYGQVTS